MIPSLCARSLLATPRPSQRAWSSPQRATPRQSGARACRGGSRYVHPLSSRAPNRQTPRRRRSHRPPVRGSRCRPIPSSANAFPLPGAPSLERTLAPDDPLLADTDGLAHLGVLLSLLDERPDALTDITFPAALAVSTPRRVRTVREAQRITLESPNRDRFRLDRPSRGDDCRQDRRHRRDRCCRPPRKMPASSMSASPPTASATARLHDGYPLIAITGDLVAGHARSG